MKFIKFNQKLIKIETNKKKEMASDLIAIWSLLEVLKVY